MAAGLISPAYVNRIIDVTWRFWDTSYTSPGDGLGSNLYLCLLVVEPYETGAPARRMFDTGDEVTYTGYARQAVPRSTSGFLGTHGSTGVSTGTSGTIQIATDKYFPLCTTSSQIVTHTALVTDNTRYSTGNEVVCYWELPRPMQLSNSSPGYYPCVFASALTIRLDD